MSRPALEVADILRAQGNRFLEHYQSSIYRARDPARAYGSPS